VSIVKRKKKNSLSPEPIFEDEQILVLSKPAGLVTTRAPMLVEMTLEDWLRNNLHYPLSTDSLAHSGLAHRLDRETSGVILVGKTAAALGCLRAQFKERSVRKKYLALVSGKIIPGEGEINLPVGRGRSRRQKFSVSPSGRPARTEYRLATLYEDSRGAKYSLLELYPKTGRTHQLRVHLSQMGYPVVADAKYAGRKTAKKQRQWCPRQFLHAHSVSFRHPRDGRPVEFTADLPLDLVECLASLRMAG
jgi:23S rRNA pseudouridine1911/1915/1917 synthase